MSEFLCTVKTLGQEVKSFCQNQLWCKDVNFGHEKCKYGRNVDSIIIVCITIESDCFFLKEMVISRKM